MTMISEPVTPSQEDVKIAKESSRKLAPLVAEAMPTIRVEIPGEGREETVELPKGVMQLLVMLLTEMSNGNAVTLMPIHAQLTTQQAADLLGVSRPFLIKEMQEGKLKYQRVGTHRRIALADVMEYRKMCVERHDRAMDELVRLNQELKLGYQ
jgi:excisionase family DNA binding protein